ncbi:MAG: response regulator [Polyangiaceae bacterium]
MPDRESSPFPTARTTGTERSATPGLCRVLFLEADVAERHRIVRVLGRDARRGLTVRGVDSVDDALASWSDVRFEGLLVGPHVSADDFRVLVSRHTGIVAAVLVAEKDDDRRRAFVEAGTVEFVRTNTLDAEVLDWSVRLARERAGAERTLRTGHRGVDAFGRTRERYVANVCQALRTPVHVVLGMAESLAATPLDDAQTTMVERLRTEAEHLAAIVDDAVDQDRVATGRATVVRGVFDVRELVTSTVEFMAVSARAKGTSITVAFASPGPSSVVGDARRVRQLLVDLLGEAVPLAGRGRVDVRVGPDAMQPDAYAIDVVVASAANDVVPRDDSDLATRLAVTSSLANRMGGSLRVGKGPWAETTLGVRIPLPAASARVRETRSSVPAPRDPNVRPRILLVDDSADNRMLVEAYFAKLPWELVTAEGGADAAAKFAADAFDLVLMDLHMPDVDGFEATRTLRRIESDLGRPSVPILALTADTLAASVGRCLDAGCTAHLAKPVGRETLLAVLAEHLGEGPSGRVTSTVSST